MERDRGKSGETGKRFERARGGAARPIAELMPQIGRTAFRRFGFVQSSVVSRWPEIVGERHARVCAPEAIAGIALASAVDAATVPVLLRLG